ncbi:unnamed protein product [Calicophoron daubneyi]|uniref:type I protein arginine methyltransferase n=1 Tax=Calicophoron daubneyi TaxID=300641 RepID=A0AAV2TCL5_CALDB
MESILESQNLGSDAKAPRMETKSSGAGLKSGDADEITRLEADNLALREELATCRRLLSSLVEHSPISENLPHSPQPGSDPASEDIVQNRDPDPYFDSYGHFAIHGEMLTDHIRTDSYRNFILSNSKPYFAGKCVLDVGCGTGILSLFAKEAGAAKVFGVEASAEIFAAAQETLRVNNLDDRITLIRDRVETVQLPVDQVDVIISEWMGYFLFFESMLDSVIIAARRFLSPDTGRIFPRHYSLHLTGISCGTKLRHDYLDLWTNTYGYQMPALRRAALAEAHVLDLTDLNVVGEESSQGYRILTSSSCELYSLDIDSFWKDTSCTLPHQVGCCPFSLLIDAPECFNLDAFVGYFDVRFDDEAPSRVCFSTSPATPTTHWKQVVFFLDKPLIVNKGDKLTGSLDILRARYDARGLEIRLHVDPPNDQLPVEQTYFLLS